MGWYEKEFFAKGYSLSLPEQKATLDLTEAKGGIYIKLVKNGNAIGVYLPESQWNELCEMRYSLHPAPLDDVDKVQSAIEECKARAETVEAEALQESEDEDGSCKE